jgi:hypothetical protein
MVPRRNCVSITPCPGGSSESLLSKTGLGRREAVQPGVELLHISRGPDGRSQLVGHVAKTPFQQANQGLLMRLRGPPFLQFVRNRSAHLEKLLAMFLRLNRGFDRVLQTRPLGRFPYMIEICTT